MDEAFVSSDYLKSQSFFILIPDGVSVRPPYNIFFFYIPTIPTQAKSHAEKSRKRTGTVFADAGSFLTYRSMAKDRLYFSLSERYTEIPAVPTGRRISPALTRDRNIIDPHLLHFPKISITILFIGKINHTRGGITS